MMMVVNPYVFTSAPPPSGGVRDVPVPGWPAPEFVVIAAPATEQRQLTGGTFLNEQGT